MKTPRALVMHAHTQDFNRGVEVLSYWSQENGAKIPSGTHTVHLKMETFFPLVGISCLPSVYIQDIRMAKFRGISFLSA